MNKKIIKKDEIVKRKISDIGVTNETLTERGGLALFVRYLTGVGIYPLVSQLFGGIRKSKKGVSVGNMFKQLFCFFFDGTSFALTRFDELAKDKGYMEVIENDERSMCSSHAVKRFFNAFSYLRVWFFRKVLQQLFIWRLKIQKPEVIILGIDTMVMDNNEAKTREGVEPTYKKVKGFQPLHLTWGRYLIDAVFRGGSKHSNHGEAVIKMIKHIVKKIRSEYREDVVIILRSDSGFFDEDNFKEFEDLKIGYICAGKLYNDIKEYVSNVAVEIFGRYENKEQAWDYVEFGDRRESWKKFRRAIFCSPHYEGTQMVFEFARQDSVLYTNLGVDKELTERFVAIGQEKYLETETVIELFHQRGNDELVHRALKDFGPEQLPMKRFESNAVFYYTMLLSFFLYEAFKEDVGAPVVAVSSYATTVRRVLVDIAAKIVHKAGKVTLKFSRAVWERLNISDLWLRCNSPPLLA